MQPTTITPEFINVRATVNEWLSQNFPIHRKDLVHSKPIQIDDSWLILLYAYAKGERSNPIGKLLLNANYDILNAPKIEDISSRVSDFLLYCLEKNSIHVPKITEGDRYDFRLGDGIESARRFVESGIDLLLTDPPYGISKAYTCEKQVSRRL